MTSVIQFSEIESNEPTFLTRETCLAAMLNKSARLNVSHCKPEWDPYSAICWGPTPIGVTALVPCPDDGYLNPNQFASRKCLSNGTWYVNHTIDDKPYTNFDNCFLPEDPSAEDDLKKLVNTKVIFILKSLDEYKRLYLILHVISIAFLVAAIIVCAAVVFKLRQKRPSTYSYIALAVAAAALLVNNAVTVSISAVDDATNVLKCRIAKSLVLVSTIVFYECVFVYFYMCLVPILQITIRTFCFKFLTAVAAILAFLLVIAEQFAETLSCPSRYCGFRTLQSKFHWLTTAPRLMLVMSNMCLDSVTIFGIFYLKQPHLEKACQMRHIRQKVICALVLVLYNIILEVLRVLIHSEAYLHYSGAPVDAYLHAYCLVIAMQGIAFTVLLCFVDLEVLSMIGLPGKCKTSHHKSAGTEDKAAQMYWHFDIDNSPVYDLDYHSPPEADVPSINVSKVELVFHTVRPEDSLETQTKIYESKLNLASET